MFPSGYSKYVSVLKKVGAKPNQKLARYAARYRMAGQIVGIELAGFSTFVAESYTNALRISLAYSALESLEAAVGRRRLPVLDQLASKTLKLSDLKSFRSFMEQEVGTSLQKELVKFFDSNGDANLRPVIEAIRHTVFHGQFNPSAAGITNKNSRLALVQIEHAIFKMMNKTSESIFKS